MLRIFGAFLFNYLANAPKYAIDANLSEEYQTIFSILFMPIFVINILVIHTKILLLRYATYHMLF